jgi:hypothetical protein
MMLTEEKSKKPEKDLYNYELKYKKEALVYIGSEKSYGGEIVKLWEECKKLEIHRLEIV